MGVAAALSLLVWPGMPAPAALEAAGRRAGRRIRADVVASNEELEARLAAGGYDLVCPSDYLVERLVGQGRLLELDGAGAGRLAGWVRDPPWDPGLRHSLPLAFGTTGFLAGRGAPRRWSDLLAPGDGVRVGMLDELREVIGAALVACGCDPNDASDASLARAEALLAAQTPNVASCSSEDFVSPVAAGDVDLHHAWSGPAALAVRKHPHLRFVAPEDGPLVWVTTGAIPADAPDPGGARAVLAALADPEIAAVTVERSGFATPSEAARRLLPVHLRDDAILFPGDEALAGLPALRDLAPDGQRRIERLWERVRARWPRRPGAVSTGAP